MTDEEYDKLVEELCENGRKMIKAKMQLALQAMDEGTDDSWRRAGALVHDANELREKLEQLLGSIGYEL